MKTINLTLLLAVAILGCTEKFTVEPQYTDETGWTPNSTLIGYGYQRIELELNDLPSMQIHRNLLRLLVEYQRVGEADFRVLDTISVVRFIPQSYLSPPRFEQNVNYSVRMTAQYRNGVTRTGNSASFLSPIVRGKILKRIPLPQPDANILYGFPEDFGFRRGELYVLEGRNIVRIDTATGTALVIKNDLGESWGFSSWNMAVLEDTAILAEYIWDRPTEVNVYWFNLNSLDTVKSVKLIIPGEGNPIDVSYDGSWFYLLWLYYASDGDMQLFKVSTVTGALVESFPRRKGTLGAIALVGTDLWAGSSSHFDNRIRRIDPSTYAALEDHRNPIFSSRDLAWDGAYFWVFDYETQAFAKLQLEGL